ncbi:uncharacterized protein LOC118750434 [Rhagoletis pomonella]|uniref:uncharacterized protein LOC118750434 n=1 Tax=Rhagoletis pomonella TaxID=28610 RepID=UPI0017849942|nr:uncharacterized protein LOC118750434 [Rhagoletis pomonella]
MDAEGKADPQFGDAATPTRSSSNNNIRVKELQREQLCRRVADLRENLLHLNAMTPSQLETKLALLEHHFTTFERLQSELEFLDDSQFELDHRIVFEESFCEVKSAIVERIAVLRRSDCLSSTIVPALNSSSSPPARHSLPKLQLTKFSGKHTEWLDFYNMFKVLVHNNAGLYDIEKFQYLRSCLVDSAFRLIQSLEVTNENYHRAVELLVNRYDNKRYIFQSHLQAIFDNGALSHPTVVSLREFIDSINAHLRAMQSLASRSQIADGILLHLIVAKLDHEMRLKWEEEVSAKWDNSANTSLQLPSWDDLASFIERRCQTVNMVKANRSASGKVTAAKTPARSSKVSSALVTSSSNNKCPLCDELATHSAFKCDKFTAMDPMQRYDLAKKKTLCLNCLSKGHVSSKCPSNNRCQYCKSAQESTQAQAVALHAHRPVNDVILATAIVQLHNNRGTSVMARALLDSASQLNFVSERTAQMLKASRTKIAMEICGIGALRTKAKYIAVVGLKSLHTGFSSSLEAVIMPSISSSQPRTTIDIVRWGIPKNINLADTSFYIPGAIDLLLGASAFFEILSVRQIKLHKNLPTLQKT